MHRLLITDDDSDYCELIAWFLAQQGYECETAKSVREARAKLAASQFTVLVTDFNLGDGFGSELVESGSHPISKTVMVTGSHRVRAPDQLLVMHKPVDLEALTRVIADFCR